MNKTQHPSNNAVLGAPPGMSREECGALPITRIEYSDGTQAVASFWTPSEAELQLLNSGKPVRLVVLGKTHPPLSLGVDGDGFL
jgi:hypothetical protein